ncbi:MAG: hypothetical protein JNK73_08460 [Bacteroidia bacterium]|nr:hypothetical protein [Bacteroidia bacterium]
MKNKLLLFASSLLLLVSCMKEMSESISDESAGLNGGFEKTKNNLPLNWLVYTQKTTGYGDFSILIDSIKAAEGKRCLHFAVKDCSNTGGRFSPGISTEIKAQAGNTFKITCKIKNTGSAFCIRLSGVNAFEASAGPELRSSESIPEWREIELKYTLAKEMEKLRLEVNVLSAGDFWIDDLKVEKVKG